MFDNLYIHADIIGTFNNPVNVKVVPLLSFLDCASTLGITNIMAIATTKPLIMEKSKC